MRSTLDGGSPRDAGLAHVTTSGRRTTRPVSDLDEPVGVGSVRVRTKVDRS
jgi:hypothetical protein